jgi:cell wall-associated NlpC family hydrolase
MRYILLFLTATLLLPACIPGNKSRKTSSTASAPAGAMQFRKNVVKAAQEYVGTTYKYAGTKPSTGFDCSGFTWYVLSQFRVEVSPASAAQAKQGREVALDRVFPGDLVFFGDGSKISHVAMVVERTKEGIICVHSTTSRGVIVENVSTSSYWKPRILFARDVIGK